MKLGDMDVPVYRDVNDKEYIMWPDVRLALGPERTETLKSWLDRNYDLATDNGVPVDVLKRYLTRNRRF